MARINREILFGINSKEPENFHLKLFLSDNCIITITDIDFNPNADATFIQIPLTEWNEIQAFIQDEINKRNG